MRNKLIAVVALSGLLLFTDSVSAQNFAALQQGAMTMTTKSKQAKQFTAMGLNHMINGEAAQAYQEFLSAVNADPNLPMPLVMLSFLSAGETRKMYGKRAQESATNKSESEILLASLAGEKMTNDSRIDVWGKLHTLNPNDRVVGYIYANSRKTPEERFQAALEYNLKYPEEPAMYNRLGYMYMNDKKDNEKAKASFEKYIQLYADGINPYDSMGDFYLATGDTTNAEKYYNLALEKYPFFNNSINQLKKIAEMKKDKDQKKD